MTSIKPFDKIRHDIKSARLEKNISIDAVSKAVGIPAKTIRDLETGYVVNPTFHNVITLIKFFELDLNKLCSRYDCDWEIDFINRCLNNMNIKQIREVKRFIRQNK